MSMELPEDDPILGASELEKLTKEKVFHFSFETEK